MPHTKSNTNKKLVDNKYVSAQPHEIKHVQENFCNAAGERPPAPLIYFMQHVASANCKRKVVRADFYKALELLGYKKTKL